MMISKWLSFKLKRNIARDSDLHKEVMETVMVTRTVIDKNYVSSANEKSHVMPVMMSFIVFKPGLRFWKDWNQTWKKRQSTLTKWKSLQNSFRHVNVKVQKSIVIARLRKSSSHRRFIAKNAENIIGWTWPRKVALASLEFYAGILYTYWSFFS